MASVVVTNLTSKTYMILVATDFVTLGPLGSLTITEAEWVESEHVRSTVNSLLAEGLISTSGVPAGYVLDGSPLQYHLPDALYSVLLVTDPNTFVSHVDFDLGRPVSVALVTATLLSFDLDGEPLGNTNDSGEITFDIQSISTAATLDELAERATNLQISVGMVRQGGVWDYDLQPFDGSPLGPLPAVSHRQNGAALRYVRVQGSPVDGWTLDTYAGSNHPTATWRIDVAIG